MLRDREAREAMSDHDQTQKAFDENRERLREERLAREATAGPMLYPAPELPPGDDPQRRGRCAR